jgi:hypothetical protein
MPSRLHQKYYSEGRSFHDQTYHEPSYAVVISDGITAQPSHLHSDLHHPSNLLSSFWIEHTLALSAPFPVYLCLPADTPICILIYITSILLGTVHVAALKTHHELESKG